MSSSSVASSVDSAIKTHKVVIFSKSWCPYCKAAKKTIKGLGLPDEDVYIDEIDQGSSESDIQDYLQSTYGQRSVPQIFINQDRIGGNSDLQKISESQLKSMVA